MGKSLEYDVGNSHSNPMAIPERASAALVTWRAVSARRRADRLGIIEVGNTLLRNTMLPTRLFRYQLQDPLQTLQHPQMQHFMGRGVAGLVFLNQANR